MRPTGSWLPSAEGDGQTSPSAGSLPACVGQVDLPLPYTLWYPMVSCTQIQQLAPF